MSFSLLSTLTAVCFVLWTQPPPTTTQQVFFVQRPPPTTTQVVFFVQQVFLDPGTVSFINPTSFSDDVIAISREDLESLYKTLLDSYDKRVRPIVDQSRSLAVNTKFVPTNIISFDTTRQRFAILYYIRVDWKDESLTWDSTLYGGTNYVKIPTRDMWMPNLKIIEEFDGNNYIGDKKTDIAKISSDGDVQWVPEGMYSVVCEVDIQYYPYDKQSCTFSYYIANEDNVTVTLDHTEEVPMDEYMENSAWKLVSITRERELKDGIYYININFRLQRRAHFATFTIVAPLIMLAFLNIGVFIVPSGSGEKGGFAITIFLAYGIYITIVSDTLPHNSLQISYFVVFILALLSVSALSVVYAIVQAKLFATIGSKQCRIPFRSQTSSNRVEPVEATDQSEGSVYTWGMLLNRLDTILCIMSFFIVIAITIIFFSITLNQVVNE